MQRILIFIITLTMFVALSVTAHAEFIPHEELPEPAPNTYTQPAEILPHEETVGQAPRIDVINGAVDSNYDLIVPPPNEIISYSLGYSSDLDIPQNDELSLLTEIRDILQIFLSLVIIGISCIVVRFIINSSLKIFTRYTRM